MEQLKPRAVKAFRRRLIPTTGVVFYPFANCSALDPLLTCLRRHTLVRLAECALYKLKHKGFIP